MYRVLQSHGLVHRTASAKPPLLHQLMVCAHKTGSDYNQLNWKWNEMIDDPMYLFVELR